MKLWTTPSLKHSTLRLQVVSGSVACMLLASSLLPGASAIAADPLFSPRALEKAMLDLYCQFPGQPPEACPAKPPLPAGSPPPVEALTAADKSVWALEIFDQAAMLDTDGFNDVLTHMAADYRQHPEHRLALELVLSSLSVEHSADVTGTEDHTADAVREKLREELANIRKRNPVITVMDDVLLAFTLAYAVQFGKGILNGGKLLATEGKGITKLERFKEIAEMVVKSDRIAKDIVKERKLLIFAAGVGMGVVEAAIDAFSTFKIDPHHLLEPVQGDIVQSTGVRAASERDELRAMMQETNDELKSHAVAYRARNTEIDKDITRMQREMEHMFNVAAQIRPQMEPIAQDLTETRKNISKLNMKLDGMELTGGLK